MTSWQSTIGSNISHVNAPVESISVFSCCMLLQVPLFLNKPSSLTKERKNEERKTKELRAKQKWEENKGTESKTRVTSFEEKSRKLQRRRNDERKTYYKEGWGVQYTLLQHQELVKNFH